MARQRFVALLGASKLNGVAYASPSGLVEPITGLTQASAIVVGAFEELSRAEALALSDTAVGTLYEGVYQLVKMDSGASFGANLLRGQILFWKPDANETFLVTNVEPTGVSMVAGIYIGPTGTSSKAPSAASPYFYMQAFKDGVASVLFQANLSNNAPAAGDSVFTAGAGAGANNATADDLGGGGTPVTLANSANYMGRFIGVAEEAPVGGQIKKVELRGGHLRF